MQGLWDDTYISTHGDNDNSTKGKDVTMNNQITTKNISEKTNSQDHVYMYIHTYMEKRKRKENSKNTNVVFYDGLDLSQLKEIALRNGTDVSSIVSNLVREFNLLFKSKTPQKTLFNFDDTEHVLDFYHDSSTWDFYIKESSQEEKEKIKNQIIMIDKKLSKYY